MDPSAPADQATKYARAERERRFLLVTVPPGEVVRTAWIRDRYLDGTRLRLRMATVREGGAARVVYKLTQKLPAAGGGPGLVTTMYLSRDEHARLAALPGHELEKTRLSVPPFGVDVFAPPRTGLVLAEVELDDDDAMCAFAPPRWAVAEVTHDPRFTGAALARASGAEIAALLREFRIEVIVG